MGNTTPTRLLQTLALGLSLGLLIPIVLFAQTNRISVGEVVPGQLVFKISNSQEFGFLNNKSVSGQFDRFSPTQTLREVESSLATYGYEAMTQVITRASFEEVRLESLQKLSPERLISEPSDDLVRTYFVRYNSEVDPFYLAGKLQSIPGVEYAEPRVQMEMTYTPNDPLFGQNGQNYFEGQRFLQAWDVTRASRDIVIAIVDSGVDYTHPDLKDNLWRNPEPGRAKRIFPELFNSVVNDTIGWNFWASGPASNPTQNANPIGTAQSHGTHVAGIAAAVSDNGVGLASAGFNSTYMAVRAGGTEDAPRAIGFGYEGILYAAVNGADVINCSFGSDFNSMFGNDVVNFATDLGSVVIGAAGNSNNEVLFYPAAYENVLSVASVVTGGGSKSSFSSYGYFVDVSSTGSSILSTVFNGNYALNSGTSMAAPVVAGLAALVRHQFPDWSPRRVMGQIRGTGNNTIYGSNPTYMDKLGTGLLNAERAVTDPVPYIRVIDVRFVSAEGSGNDKLGLNEAGFMELTLVNFGEGSSVMTYQVTNTNQTATVAGGVGTTTALSSTGSEVVIRIPITINDGALAGAIPEFRVGFRDTQMTYEDFRYVRYENLFVDTHDANRVRVSATSNGAIGFYRTSQGDTGVGFIPIVETSIGLQELGNMLYEAGIMIETNIDNEVHMLTNVRETNLPPQMFRPTTLFGIEEDPGIQSGFASFNTNLQPGKPLMEVKMRTFAIDSPLLDQSLLVYYTIRNADPSRLAMNDTYVGMFADWDIGNYGSNRVRYRTQDSLMVVEDPTSAHLPYFTLAHLGGISSALAINNAYEGAPDSLNFGIYYSASNSSFDGFTLEEKRWSLKAGLGKTSQPPSDVSLVTASGPFTIRYNQEITVGFIFSFGQSEEALASQVRSARMLNLINTTPNFNAPRVPVFIPTEVSIAGNYPNPFNPTTNILIDMERPGRAIVEVYDIMGRKISTIFDERLNNRRYEVVFDGTGLASGIYVVVLRTDQGVRTRTITLLK